MKKKSVRKKKVIPRHKKMPSTLAFVIVSLLLAISFGVAVRSIINTEKQQVSGATSHISPTIPQSKR
jgi:multidrug resistance efflux pump